jgi:hypothetical protein
MNHVGWYEEDFCAAESSLVGLGHKSPVDSVWISALPNDCRPLLTVWSDIVCARWIPLFLRASEMIFSRNLRVECCLQGGTCTSILKKAKNKPVRLPSVWQRSIPEK